MDDDDEDTTNGGSEEEEEIVSNACVLKCTQTHCTCITHTHACGVNGIKVFFIEVCA